MFVVLFEVFIFHVLDWTRLIRFWVSETDYQEPTKFLVGIFEGKWVPFQVQLLCRQQSHM